MPRDFRQRVTISGLPAAYAKNEKEILSNEDKKNIRKAVEYFKENLPS